MAIAATAMTAIVSGDKLLLFGTARRNRNPRGEKLFKKLLSAQVCAANPRGEKLFKKLLSAQVLAKRPFRARLRRKPARNGTSGALMGLRVPIRTRLRSKPARNGTKWQRGRNPRGEKLFKKLLSAQVCAANPRGEKLFKKLLSA